MSEFTIKNLQDVLRESITKGRKVSSTNIKTLTAPGDNYGSTMLQLDVTVKNETDGTEEEIHGVAKKLPELEEFRTAFNVQVTFKNEIAMYDTIVPTLQNFQKDIGVSQTIDCFPKLYGARINLGEENGTVDDNAVLILENLKIKGYEVVDRFRGFDLETTELILKDLAAFHGVPLALKLRKPEVFDKKVRPYLAPFRPPSFPDKDRWTEMIMELFQDSYKCIPWIPKLKKIYENVKAAHDIPPREPFSTITHGDMWVNNMMVKFQNGIPLRNKIIDFQVCDYRSPATDLFFFLFSSVQLSVLQNELDRLIEFYHQHFISHLKEAKCDVAPFSLPKFLEEMKAATATEIVHAIGMTLFIVFGRQPIGQDDNKGPPEPDFKKMKEGLDLAAVEKVSYMIQICGKKGWL